MNEVGTTRQYNELLGQAKAIPFLKTEDYDLDRYVIGKALKRRGDGALSHLDDSAELAAHGWILQRAQRR